VRFVPLDAPAPSVSWAEAIDGGTAPGGALWVPDELPAGGLAGAADQAFTPWAAARAGEWLDASVAGADLDAALDLPVRLRPLGDRIELLDLTGGPSGAFKDIGARVLARLWAAAPLAEGGERRVLVATSGDTGGAVAAAVDGVPGLRAWVVFPRGRVSEVQRRQFTTRGDRVVALAVDGTFDDCQSMVRAAFEDRSRTRELNLVSANSINPGRLLPQTLYHAWAAGRAPGRPLVVPSGNLGNVLSALLAREMGAPLGSIHAAVNENDALVRASAGAAPHTARALATDSSAMDVARPSNLARLHWLAARKGIPLRHLANPVSIPSDAARAAQRHAWEEHGVVIDPHTAVGVARALELIGADPAVRPIVVETAHPAKFPEVVRSVLGREPPPAPHLETDQPERIRPVAPTLAALLEAVREPAPA